MAGYFNNHTQQRLSQTTTTSNPIPSTQTITANPLPPPQRLNSKLFSTTLASNGEKEKEKASSSNSSVQGTGSLGSRTPHPLRYTWTFWFRQQRTPNKTLDYESGIKRIGSFASVESFWSLFTHLQQPSGLIPTTDYLLFHSGVRRPVWEDPLNLAGGKWIIRLKKGVADRLWEDLVCAVVGDQFVDDGDSDVGVADVEGRSGYSEICGCTISVRNNEDILSVWNKGTDPKVNARIRNTIKRVLNLPSNIIMEYKTNSDSMGDKSSFRNSSIDRSATQ